MLSIVIVNYKSEKYLTKCISSIKEKVLGVDHEVIIVNNDEEKKLEAKLPKDMRLINSGGNIGFGAACNLGAKSAKGEILCFLNPDTEIVSENIDELLKKLEDNKKVAVIGPRLVTENGKTQWWCAGKDFSIWQLFKNNVGVIDSKKIWESEKEILADWVSGAALLAKKEVFEKIGGFDERYFMYAEDMDLCRRIRALGFNVLYAPQFVVLHKCGKSRDSVLRQKMQFFKSSLRYLIKWF
jgi:N-acetylglucosaminyl-diphospho-decaprenol L-rhamnosyltransferase